MPTIDVTDVLLGDDIAGQTFTVYRRKEVVNSHGRPDIVETAFQAVGSINPLGDNSLLREEMFTANNNGIEVITTFRLQSTARIGADKYQPDEILWEGSRYVVRYINDYTTFGAGFVQAECASKTYVDDGPAA